MAQIQKGTTYSTGQQVTAANLNALADSAILLPGAITDQIAAASIASSDKFLVNQSGGLVQATAAQVIAPCVKLDGSAAMAGALTLSGNPVNALEAVPKQYVDAADLVLNNAVTAVASTVSGLTNSKVNKAGDTMTGPLALPGNPSSALEAAPKQYVDTTVSTTLPTGAIIPFFRSSAPSGWLECNGQSTSGYAALAALIGANVPDLRGEFIRGWDNGRGVDSGRAIGTAQDQAIQSHTHTVAAASGAGGTYAYQWTQGGALSGSNAQASGGPETRPRNVAMMYCIKT